MKDQDFMVTNSWIAQMWSTLLLARAAAQAGGGGGGGGAVAATLENVRLN